MGQTPENFISKTLRDHGSVDAAVSALTIRSETDPVNSRLDLQVLLNALGREEDSFAVCEELYRIAPDDARVRFNRGWHLIKRNRLLEGLQFLEAGRFLNTYGHGRLQTRMPIWHQDTGRGQRVHLVLEGGLGDEIIHFRFGRDLVENWECKVTVVCNKSLAPLFVNESWVSAVLQREAALGVFHDSWIPGMSAAHVLGYEHTDLDPSPYLTVAPESRAKWRAKIAGSAGRPLKVGIRWAGNPQFEHQQLRIFPPEMLLDLDHPKVRLYSFQRDHHLQPLPGRVIDLAPELVTWADTAAALNEMDLVISSCTSVAHCSAALGKPTWIVVPALPYFIWALPGDRTPWYQTARVVRQRDFGQWDDVRERLHGAFQQWADGRKADHELQF